MSYDWLETLVMGIIFLAAALFATRHFVPSIYKSARHFFLSKNASVNENEEISVTSGNTCQTKCSACNGCSLANKS